MIDGLRIHDLQYLFASIGSGAGLRLPVVGKLVIILRQQLLKDMRPSILILYVKQLR